MPIFPGCRSIRPTFAVYPQYVCYSNKPSENSSIKLMTMIYVISVRCDVTITDLLWYLKIGFSCVYIQFTAVYVSFCFHRVTILLWVYFLLVSTMHFLLVSTMHFLHNISTLLTFLFTKLVTVLTEVPFEGVLIEGRHRRAQKDTTIRNVLAMQEDSMVWHSPLKWEGCGYGQSISPQKNLLVHGTGLVTPKHRHCLNLDTIFFFKLRVSLLCNTSRGPAESSSSCIISVDVDCYVHRTSSRCLSSSSSLAAPMVICQQSCWGRWEKFSLPSPISFTIYKSSYDEFSSSPYRRICPRKVSCLWTTSISKDVLVFIRRYRWIYKLKQRDDQ